ncbi:MAG: hypothetical protein Q8L60_06645 [Gammaproteobacteria bacterium]|nr:hypothetical protein [Gammaproteobacteria bacterium]MDP2346187.1 hypothetical protein [Gammaproteobacteria bacterium]
MNSDVSRLALNILVFLGALFVGGAVLAQSGTPASVPSVLRGGYTLVMTDAVSSSSIKNGDVLEFTLGDSSALCSKGLVLKSPVVRGLSTYWDSDALDLSFRLVVSQQGATQVFEGLDLLTFSGTLLGRLEVTGSANIINPCGDPAPDTSRANDLFDALEIEHGDLFPANPFSTNQIGGGYDVYRFYQSTGVYLAVLDELVYARGGDFGEQFVIVGILDELIDDPSDLERPYFTEYAGNVGLLALDSNDLEFIQGTYRLSLTNALPYSPIPEGTELVFVITPQGQMCVGETVLGFPRFFTAIDDEDELTASASWRNIYGDVSYDIFLNRNETLDKRRENFALGSINYRTASANFYYGTFEGLKISLSTECIDANGGNPDIDDINELFGLIEAQYPKMFPSGPQTYNQYNDGFVYRYYYETGIFAGVKGGQVYVNGGQFGTSVDPDPVGSLQGLLEQLNTTPVESTVPISQVGTYAMSFSDATAFSPFTNGTNVTVALSPDGGLCLDGVLLADAVSRPSEPGLVIWENANTGFRLSLSLGALSNTEMSLGVASTSGVSYAKLAGTKISLSGGCGAAGLNIELANQLYALAEQHHAALFPASMLSFNQINGDTVTRYYSATGTFLTVTGDQVSVRGGPFGSTSVQVGVLASLIQQIIADNTPPIPPPPPAPIYDMIVEGTKTVQTLNLAVVNTRFESRKYQIERPDGSNTAALRAVVADSLKGEVTQIGSVSITIVQDTAASLIFRATISADSSTGSTQRTYVLTYSFAQR